MTEIEYASLVAGRETMGGFHLDWSFNSKSVAEYFQSLVEPPVKWKAFDCDQDNDHTW